MKDADQSRFGHCNWNRLVEERHEALLMDKSLPRGKLVTVFASDLCMFTAERELRLCVMLDRECRRLKRVPLVA